MSISMDYRLAMQMGAVIATGCAGYVYRETLLAALSSVVLRLGGSR